MALVTHRLAPTAANVEAAMDFRGRVRVDHKHGARPGRRALLRPYWLKGRRTWFVRRYMGHWAQDIVAVHCIELDGRCMAFTVELGPTYIRRDGPAA